MTTTELKAYCKTQLATLDISGDADSNAALIVRNLKTYCYNAGLIEFALTLPIESKKYPISAAIQLKRTLAELEPQSEALDDALLNLEQASELLGYKPAGLRKIVKQGRIQYLQNGQGPIRFKREWLDDFISANAVSGNGKANKRLPAKAKQPLEVKYGFDPALFLR